MAVLADSRTDLNFEEQGGFFANIGNETLNLLFPVNFFVEETEKQFPLSKVFG